MTEHSLWRFSRALHRAINERQPQDLEPLLDDGLSTLYAQRINQHRYIF